MAIASLAKAVKDEHRLEFRNSNYEALNIFLANY